MGGSSLGDSEEEDGEVEHSKRDGTIGALYHCTARETKTERHTLGLGGAEVEVMNRTIGVRPDARAEVTIATQKSTNRAIDALRRPVTPSPDRPPGHPPDRPAAPPCQSPDRPLTPPVTRSPGNGRLVSRSQVRIMVVKICDCGQIVAREEPRAVRLFRIS